MQQGSPDIFLGMPSSKTLLISGAQAAKIYGHMYNASSVRRVTNSLPPIRQKNVGKGRTNSQPWEEGLGKISRQ